MKEYMQEDKVVNKDVNKRRGNADILLENLDIDHIM